MSELISAKQISDEFKVSVTLVCNYLDAAKIPAHKLMVGTEAVSLYEKAGAFKAVDTRIKEEKALEKAHLAKLEAAKIPTLKDLMVAVKAISKDVSDVAELQEEIKRLVSANQVMFKALTDFKTDTADRLSGLKTLVVNMRDDFNASSREVVSSEAKSVAVVGISTMHHSAIAAEFGDAIKLKLLDPSDIRGIHNLRGYEKVFLMKKTTDYKHLEQLKSVKVQPEAVSGSIDELKEKLTAYYLAL